MVLSQRPKSHFLYCTLDTALYSIHKAPIHLCVYEFYFSSNSISTSKFLFQLEFFWIDSTNISQSWMSTTFLRIFPFSRSCWNTSRNSCFFSLFRNIKLKFLISTHYWFTSRLFIFTHNLIETTLFFDRFTFFSQSLPLTINYWICFFQCCWIPFKLKSMPNLSLFFSLNVRGRGVRIFFFTDRTNSDQNFLVLKNWIYSGIA